MIQSPSKYLSIPFLKDLAENRFISPRGIEYSEPEVTELLIVKEMHQASLDFSREMRERKNTVIDHAASMRSFQESIFAPLKFGDHKNLSENTSQEETRCSLIKADTIFPLPVIPSQVLIASSAENQHQSKGRERVMAAPPGRRTKEKRMKEFGKPITKERFDLEMRKTQEFLDRHLNNANQQLKDLHGLAKRSKTRGESSR